MNFNEIIDTYGIYLLYFVGILVIAIVVWIIQYRFRKGKAQKFIAEHPDAAKIYLTSKALITQEAVTVHTVNGELPVVVMENGKSGVYAIPGEVNLGISYTYTRPGVMYRNVTQTTGLIEKTVDVEANKSYMLSFDRKAEEFVFEEV